MKPVALIVDDHPSIREVLEDRMEALGHDHDSAGTQEEARGFFQHRRYGYILLDMEIPSRYGKPASISNGKILLREIRGSEFNAETPVLVITAHGLDSTDLVVEVWRMGATDFIKKPFGENLETAIQEALDRERKKSPGSAHTSGETTILRKPELLVTKDQIELNGVILCTSTSGIIWKIMCLLLTRREDGKFPILAGGIIAKKVEAERGQNAVSDAVGDKRRKWVKLLATNGYQITEDSIIARGRGGYQLSPKLKIADHSELPASETVAHEPDQNDRADWIIQQLEAGVRVRRADLQARFGIAEATAKRDLSGLESQIEFLGSGKKGYYQLK